MLEAGNRWEDEMLQETTFRVVALPSQSRLRLNPDAKPAYAWFGQLDAAQACMKECRSRKVYGHVFVEKEK